MTLKNPRRLGAVVTATVALAAGLLAPAAQAHVKVKRTSPSGTAPTSTKSVKVVFTGEIRSGTLKVKGPNGDRVSAGSGGRDPRNVRRLIVGLESGLDKGKYKAKWQIVAADSHHQKGKFTFRLN